MIAYLSGFARGWNDINFFTGVRNMKRTRIAGISLLILFLMTALTHASGGGQSPGSKASEPVKLSFMSDVNVDTEGYDLNDSPYVEFIEKKFNVDLEIVSESANYPQKLNTTLASGKLPDYFLVYSRADVERWAHEGLLMNLDPYIENAPMLKEQIIPLAWELSSYDSKKYAVPVLRVDKTPYVVFARKDYLQNLNINPVSIKNIDDWYSMLRALTFNDPDKNGKNDTYGLLFRPVVSGALLDYFNGATAQIINGEVIPFFLTEGYKNYLKWMSRLYREGIMDPTYLVTSSQQVWDKIDSGSIGAFETFWSTAELRAKEFDLEKLVTIDPLVKPNGQRSFYKYRSPIRNYTAISHSSKNTEKIIEILNWAVSEEGSSYVLAGLEGRDYTRLPNGTIDIKPDRRGKNTALRFITLGTQRPNIDTPFLQGLFAQTYGDTGLSFFKKSEESGGYDEIALLTPYFPELALYDLNQPVDEFRDLAIMGKVDIDAEWNDYVNRWKNAGGNESIRLTTDWYNKKYKK
jgi:putative aldouronate transport system substrate-binding protein